MNRRDYLLCKCCCPFGLIAASPMHSSSLHTPPPAAVLLFLLLVQIAELKYACKRCWEGNNEPCWISAAASQVDLLQPSCF
mmetsp:Transcript_23737/g.65876  ORF Transcript_23737/g.65876 Transcript_23737/m.65876 type:complete len:81 (+) Transcript_23737:1827-2069(+)